MKRSKRLETLELKKPAYLYDTKKKEWIVSVCYGHINYSKHMNLAIHLTFIAAYEVSKQAKELTNNQFTLYQQRTSFDYGDKKVLRTDLKDVCSL